MITMTTDNHDSLSPAQIAERADLCYVSDSEPGYRRKRWERVLLISIRRETTLPISSVAIEMKLFSWKTGNISEGNL
jgi:hypothetical protein